MAEVDPAQVEPSEVDSSEDARAGSLVVDREQPVLRSDRDGLATLTLNRPDKLNALPVRPTEDLVGCMNRG